MPVVGQAYFDKGEKILSVKDLRGVWTGTLQSSENQNYVLSFIMQGNMLNPTTPAESPYHGTINFHLKNEVLDGTFKDHDLREGVAGTITAHRHQQA